jgi:hypothetical protein
VVGSAENAAPTRKATERPIRTEVESASSSSSRKNSSTTKTTRVRNCRFR